MLGIRPHAIALVVAFAGCGSPAPDQSPDVTALTTEELRQFVGKRVHVEGVLRPTSKGTDGFDGEHARFEASYIPNYNELFSRREGDPSKSKKRVRLTGVLEVWEQPPPKPPVFHLRNVTGSWPEEHAEGD